MIIKVPKDAYKGVDGSSLSPMRCDQMLLVYNFLEEMGEKTISYMDIQEEADSLGLFGNSKARSVIRTFFPLLKKIEFVNYDDKFPANQCFTPIGKQFILAHRAYTNTTDGIPHNEEIRARLEHIKQNLQTMGLIRMNKSAEYGSHKIWIAIKLLRILDVLNWNDFIYAIYNSYQGIEFSDIISAIKNQADKIHSIEYQNERGDALPDTCFTYIRSFLNECHLITNIDNDNSKITTEFDYFHSQLIL